MKNFASRALPIKILILDVDGILTDGLLFYDNHGNEHRNFHVQDGLGIQLLQKKQITVAVISGKSSVATELRLKKLGIKFYYLGQKDKINCYNALKKELQLMDNQIAYMGDDLPDLPVLSRVGLAITVPAASASVQSTAHYITQKQGGHGAVREVCDLLLQAQGHYPALLESFYDATFYSL